MIETCIEQGFSNVLHDEAINFLQHCDNDADFMVPNAILTLKRFERDYKSKVKNIYQYLLKPPNLEQCLITSRGLAVTAFAVHMSNTTSNRSDTYRTRLNRIYATAGHLGLEDDLLDECIDTYFDRISDDIYLYWNRKFSWEEYYNSDFQYDNTVTENELKIFEKIPEKPKVPTLTAKCLELMDIEREIMTLFSNHPSMEYNKFEVWEKAGEKTRTKSTKTVKRYLDNMYERKLLYRKNRYVPNSERYSSKVHYYSLHASHRCKKS